MLYRMAALKLERFQEKAYVGVLFQKRCPAHFPRKLQTFFGQSISQKHLGTTDMKECSFI